MWSCTSSPPEVFIVYFVNQYGGNVLFTLDLCSSGMLHGTEWFLVTDVSGRRVVPIFKRKSHTLWAESLYILLTSLKGQSNSVRRTPKKNENLEGYFHASRRFLNLVPVSLVS
jgi:hypothetical protein